MSLSVKKDPRVLLGCGLVKAFRGLQVRFVGEVHECGQIKARWGSAPGHTPGSQDKARPVDV